MIKVLLLCEYPSLNGGERSMLALVDAMGKGGVNLVFAAPAKGPLGEELKRRGIPHVAWNVFNADGQRRSLTRIRAQLHEILAREQPTLLHANSLSAARISGPVAGALELHSIGHLRDILKLNRQAIEDINCHARLLAVSHATRDWHVRQGLAADNTLVIHNGVDSEQFKPSASTGYLRDELGLPEDAVIALSIGQIGLRKGLDITLESVRRVSVEFSNLHWVVVGERSSTKDEAVEFERRLKQGAEAIPLRGHVHFLGRRTDVLRLLAEATLLIHAARQEPLGRVLLEAAACGLPTIASQVGGTEEIFPAESRSALLIPPDDSVALAEAIRRLLASPALRGQLSTAARKRAVEQFDVRAAAQSLLEQYRAIAAGSI